MTNATDLIAQIDAAMTSCEIKGTAMNRNKPRVWLEKVSTKMHGWQRWDAYTLTIAPDAIVVTRHNGPKTSDVREMSGREKNGKQLCILDLTITEAQRQSILRGSDKFLVTITYDQIVFTAP